MTVLDRLAESPGAVVSRAELLEAAWPNVVVGEEVLTHTISELRRQLDDDSRSPRFIETVHKSGYRLLAEVKEAGRDSSGPTGKGIELAVAVLPFANMTGNSELDGYALLLSDEIVDALTGLTGVRVAYHDSARVAGAAAFCDAPLEPTDMHIEGRVVGTPGFQRVNARIVDRRRDSYLWSRTFGSDVSLRALPAEIASHISSAIASHAAGWRHDSSNWRSVNPESYVTHLRANELFYQGGRANVHDACELFSRAANLDPTFALPQTGLAKCLAFLHIYYEPSKSFLSHAIDIAEATVRSNPQFAMAHATLGLVLSLIDDFEASASCFGSAIRLGSDAFEPHYLFGRTCFANGKFAMAAAMCERAAQLRNEDFHASVLAAKAHRALGDEARARRSNLRAIHRLGNYLGSYPDDLRATCDRACCLVELGDIDQALDCSAPIGRSEDPLVYYLAGAFARAGHKPEALDCLERIIDAGWSHADWLRHDPDLESLRGEARFRRVEKSLRLH